jgi:hypothetical protein
MRAPIEVEITVFCKKGGALTKHISSAADGSVKSDGSACVMSKGTARRFRFGCMARLGELLVAVKQNEAIATGKMLASLPDQVEVVTKNKLNGANHPGIIARTQDFITHRPGEQEIALLDFDRKGMPAGVAAKIEAAGGFFPTLATVLPALTNAARVERASTSAGLYDSRTGKQFHHLGGLHEYILIADGEDSERFLKTLHARCCNSGLGWMMVGAGGQLLERSIVDRVVGSPERLVFVAAPTLSDPLAQNLAARQPFIVEGEPLDTAAHCPPLTIVELAKLREWRAKEAHRLAGECAKARELFVARQSKKLAERRGLDPHQAPRIIERQCEGVLLPDVELPFDDPELEGKTVADVLAHPERFEGETLADPLEGPEYGMSKAMVMRNADGSMWIHSYAHGRTVYELKHDYAAVKAALEQAAKDDAPNTFIRLVLVADLREDEIERLKQITADRSSIGVRALAATLKAARHQQAARQAQQEHDRRVAERRDPRPQLPEPPADAEWKPMMKGLNEVIGASRALEPPSRNPDKRVALACGCHIPSLHFLTSEETNETDDDG